MLRCHSERWRIFYRINVWSKGRWEGCILDLVLLCFLHLWFFRNSEVLWLQFKLISAEYSQRSCLCSKQTEKYWWQIAHDFGAAYLKRLLYLYPVAFCKVSSCLLEMASESAFYWDWLEHVLWYLFWHFFWLLNSLYLTQNLDGWGRPPFLATGSKFPHVKCWTLQGQGQTGFLLLCELNNVVSITLVVLC